MGPDRRFERLAADGRTVVLGVPDAEDTEHLGRIAMARIQAAEAEAEAEFDGDDSFTLAELIEELVGDDELVFDEDELERLAAEPVQLHPTWWAVNRDCDHDGSCDCGFVTLLEVLHVIDPAERPAALAVHVAVMREVWDHYWSSHALVETASESLDGTCAWCIANGRSHLAGIGDEAAELAEQFGEAFAAFHGDVSLGQSRYPDLPGRDA